MGGMGTVAVPRGIGANVARRAERLDSRTLCFLLTGPPYAGTDPIFPDDEIDVNDPNERSDELESECLCWKCVDMGRLAELTAVAVVAKRGGSGCWPVGGGGRVRLLCRNETCLFVAFVLSGEEGGVACSAAS